MSTSRRLLIAQSCGFALALAIVLYAEGPQLAAVAADPAQFLNYAINPDTTWPAVALLLAPAFWWWGKLKNGPSNHETDSMRPGVPAPRGGVAAAWLMSVVLFFFSIAATVWAGREMAGMPPAYHDEYSYIFQAKTFLAGRLYFPTHPHAEFFDQMHVLNDNGVFASRYFPGVGLWLAPWLAIGRPYWGYAVAGGLVTVFVFWIGRELASNVAGFVAGLLTALSPAMLVFGNLLLSHHPTLVGLTAFVLCYLQATRTAGLVRPALGGAALAFAMLCRPLTAFGFALPFAVHLVRLTGNGSLRRARARWVAAVTPLVFGLVVLARYNAAITGCPLRSPYGVYLQTYTPRHVYGFHNVTRGERHLGPKVLDNYDRWATEGGDLTLGRALHLLRIRVLTSMQWTVGVVAGVWLLGVFVGATGAIDARWWLLAAAAIGVHAAYFPYAFEGIFGLSYVFETVPFVCLLFAAAAAWIVRAWWEARRWTAIVWLCVFAVSGLLGPLTPRSRTGRLPVGSSWMEPGGPVARFRAGQSQVAFARGYYLRFERLLALADVRPPALVFIRPTSADRHLDLVTNSPTLDDPILRVRDRGARNHELIATMPDRTPWHLDASTSVLMRISMSHKQ